MNGRTPGPWAVTKGKSRKITAGGILICNAVLRNSATAKQNAAGKGEEEAEANAAFIVRACNNHDALLEALQGLYGAIDSCVELTPRTLDKARAAIAAATDAGS